MFVLCDGNEVAGSRRDKDLIHCTIPAGRNCKKKLSRLKLSCQIGKKEKKKRSKREKER
jgi:hypothetical protein